MSQPYSAPNNWNVSTTRYERDSKDFGLPQTRRRVYIIAAKHRRQPVFLEHTECEKTTLSSVVF